MTDPKELTPEERANEERDAHREARDDDKGLIDTLSKSVESFTNPLVNQTPDVDEIEQQRKANDADSRES